MRKKSASSAVVFVGEAMGSRALSFDADRTGAGAGAREGGGGPLFLGTAPGLGLVIFLDACLTGADWDEVLATRECGAGLLSVADFGRIPASLFGPVDRMKSAKSCIELSFGEVASRATIPFDFAPGDLELG